MMKTLYVTDLDGTLLNRQDFVCMLFTEEEAINDIPMFELPDECYAVENGVEKLKKAATGVIPCNERDGVARRLLENVKKQDLQKV